MIASLEWIARQVRPALSDRVSRLQARLMQATIFACRDCNRVLTNAKDTSGVGIRICSNGVNWDDAMVCTITDASFYNEARNTRGGKQEHRSQQGYVVALASPDVIVGQLATVHPICWSSTTIKRVC